MSVKPSKKKRIKRVCAHFRIARFGPDVEDDNRVDRGGLVLQGDFLDLRFDHPAGAVPESIASGIASSNHANTKYFDPAP